MCIRDRFGGFFLDGQVIAIDDYLEIRPEKRAQVEKCIREGKIQTGPWYILQDEFLTSGEACVRNLQVGMQEAEQYGAVGNVGYFPDAFGNAGQMPQVLKQAGMEAVVFGRGVKPIGPNKEVPGGPVSYTHLICGFVGAGGGMMLLLVLTSVLGYELKTAVGTSVFIMTFTALTGAVSHFYIGGKPNFPIMIACVISTLVFAQLGAKWANSANVKMLNRVTGILLCVLGMVMLFF